ncbi:MAG TPA: energy transducer TonB [Lysobacter sp.]
MRGMWGVAVSLIAGPCPAQGAPLAADRATKKWSWMIGGVLMLGAGLALAGGRTSLHERSELSMLVTGTIDIEPDGRVSSYALDRPEALPPAVKQVMDHVAPAWTFEPPQVDGKPVRARTAMTARIVAKRDESGKGFSVRVAGATFGKLAKDEFVSGKTLSPPRYPKVAGMSHASGTVYVVVRIGRDGRVEDALVERVNLTVIDSESGMKRWRGMLGKAAVEGAREWTFNPPTRGAEVDAPFWLARVPVSFYVNNAPAPYGQWEVYVPGPRETTRVQAVDASPDTDAFADGGIHPLGGDHPRLLTPLEGA